LLHVENNLGFEIVSTLFGTSLRTLATLMEWKSGLEHRFETNYVNKLSSCLYTYCLTQKRVGINLLWKHGFTKKIKNRTFCGELSFEIMGTSMSTSFQTENRIEFVA